MRGATSDTGSIIQNSDYMPYGPPSPQQPAATDPDFGFTGHLKCPFTGLTLSPYRVLGYANWLSRDPIGEAGGINLYSYVANNPTNWIDPLGLINWSQVRTGAITSTVAVGSMVAGAALTASTAGAGVVVGGVGMVSGATSLGLGIATIVQGFVDSGPIATPTGSIPQGPIELAGAFTGDAALQSAGSWGMLVFPS